MSERSIKNGQQWGMWTIVIQADEISLQNDDKRITFKKEGGMLIKEKKEVEEPETNGKWVCAEYKVVKGEEINYIEFDAKLDLFNKIKQQLTNMGYRLKEEYQEEMDKNGR